MPAASPDRHSLAINTIRTLSMDAVQKANSGHPGTPMALAPMAYTLWQDFLRYDPANPAWPNRDRFVLSNGHASMLLYSLLHLAGVKELDKEHRPTGRPAVSLEDIKNFRQWGSKTPGHPESHLTSGVETTTGPLGQGAGNSVGMAIASYWLAAHFNRPGFELFDFDVYVSVGDGDLMEGVASEAASIAGHMKLGNLCWVYDNNHITIDGNTKLSFSEDVGKRFEAYGWRVTHVHDANDLGKIREAFKFFKDGKAKNQPTLVVLDSQIGYGAPNKVNTSSAHGEPLGEEEIKLAKKAYGWPEDAKFLVPPEATKAFTDGIGKRGHELHEKWSATFAKYREAHPELAAEFDAIMARKLPPHFPSPEQDGLEPFPPDPKGIATRDSSQKVMMALGKHYPWLIGGCADLAASTKAIFKGEKDVTLEHRGGRNLHFGIREHGMGAIVNGLALSGLRPFGSTFLIFSDYERPAIRLSAIMELPTIQVFSHDSIGLGEDGPTHQPIEQLASLRAIPGHVVIRPCDANEVIEAWRTLLRLQHEPVALVLSRQKVPTLDRKNLGAASGLAKGAYVLREAQGGKPQAILIATGSDVSIALESQAALQKEGIAARVVSMPSWELFERQPEGYRESVLPKEIFARVSIETATTFGWQKWVGDRGATIGMSHFGASAPIAELLEKFGFTPAHVVKAVKKLLNKD